MKRPGNGEFALIPLTDTADLLEGSTRAATLGNRRP